MCSVQPPDSNQRIDHVSADSGISSLPPPPPLTSPYFSLTDADLKRIREEALEQVMPDIRAILDERERQGVFRRHDINQQIRKLGGEVFACHECGQPARPEPRLFGSDEAWLCDYHHGYEDGHRDGYELADDTPLDTSTNSARRPALGVPAAESSRSRKKRAWREGWDELADTAIRLIEEENASWAKIEYETNTSDKQMRVWIRQRCEDLGRPSPV